MEGRRRRWLFAGLALVLALAAAWLWRTALRGVPESDGGVRPVAAEPPARPPPATAAEPTPASPAAQPALPEAVTRYLADTAYPPTSGRLDAGDADLLEPSRRYERMRPLPGAEGEPELGFLWTADRYAYTSDQVVHARFEALSGDTPARVRQLEAWAQPEGRSGAEGEAIALAFRPEGDALVADLPLSGALREHHGPVALVARFGLRAEPLHEERIRIFVTPAQGIPAHFTGSFRDAVRDGSLAVEVGIQVDEPGFYRIDANLFDAAGEPLAWASHKGELGRHDGHVTLEFFGKVLRDAERPGPYVLRQLRGYLFRDGHFPDRLNLRAYDGEHRTRDYAVDDFSEDEWDDEHRRRMVELMLQDQAAGRSLDVPALAAPETGVDPAPEPEGPTGPAPPARAEARPAPSPAPEPTPRTSRP